MAASGKRSRKGARKRAGNPPGEVARKVAPPHAAREPVRPAIKLYDEERAQLCTKTLVTLRTIAYWAAGYAVHRTTKLRLEAELERMEIDRKERERLALANGQRRKRRAPVFVEPRPEPLRSEVQS
jgi:hypothetical protein